MLRMDSDTERAYRLVEADRQFIVEAKSVDYCRYLACLALDGMRDSARNHYLARWPRGIGAGEIRKDIELGAKAAVLPGTGTGWGAPLVGVQSLADGFITIVRSSSLFGKIPGLRLVPFSTKVPFETGPGNYWWVGEGTPKPLSAMAFGSTTLDLLKAVSITPFTKEFLRLAVPGTEVTLRDTLRAGLVAFQDKALLDPLSTAIPGVRPASITSGTVAIPSTGNLPVDVQSLIDAFFTGRPGAQDPVLIAGGAKAAKLRAMQPGFGLPIYSSEAAGGTVVMLDPAGVLYADGGIEIGLSEAASLQMSDTPDNPSTATTVNVSMFQTNAVAYRIERFLNFQALTGAVRYLAA
jgi:hypothetical protein